MSPTKTTHPSPFAVYISMLQKVNVIKTTLHYICSCCACHYSLYVSLLFLYSHLVLPPSSPCLLHISAFPSALTIICKYIIDREVEVCVTSHKYYADQLQTLRLSSKGTQRRVILNIFIIIIIMSLIRFTNTFFKITNYFYKRSCIFTIVGLK